MDLCSQFSGRRDDDGTDMVPLDRFLESQETFDGGDQEGQSLAAARDCLVPWLVGGLLWTDSISTNLNNDILVSHE